MEQAGVRAAGAVLIARSTEGPRVLLLRNARHGTWGFPKGRLEAGETEEEGARREIAEETGGLPWRRIEGFAERLRYPLPESGTLKEVVYFLGEVAERDIPSFARSAEHSAHRWATPSEA
ncbi:MAG: NUDIX domain-containing protein, partial [Caldilineae bacterium]